MVRDEGFDVSVSGLATRTRMSSVVASDSRSSREAVAPAGRVAFGVEGFRMRGAGCAPPWPVML